MLTFSTYYACMQQSHGICGRAAVVRYSLEMLANAANQVSLLQNAFKKSAIIQYIYIFVQYRITLKKFKKEKKFNEIFILIRNNIV